MRGSPSVSSYPVPMVDPPALDPNEHALFLDFDGTLVDIAERPEDVVLTPDLRDQLSELNVAMGGAIALLSGRTTVTLRNYVGDAISNIAGVHGQDIAAHGLTAEAQPSPPAISAAAEELQRMQHAGVLDARIEDKRLSLALHYRHAPHAEADVRRIAHMLATRRQLRVLEGKMVVELLASSFDKGDALNAFMRTPTFNGRTPIMIGDDTTDEDAFVAAHAQGGFGILVGPPRQSIAQFALPSPAAVQGWLRAGFRK
jgi:trehalose 6-phosphate phosphatase